MPSLSSGPFAHLLPGRLALAYRGGAFHALDHGVAVADAAVDFFEVAFDHAGAGPLPASVAVGLLPDGASRLAAVGAAPGSVALRGDGLLVASGGRREQVAGLSRGDVVGVSVARSGGVAVVQFYCNGARVGRQVELDSDRVFAAASLHCAGQRASFRFIPPFVSRTPEPALVLSAPSPALLPVAVADALVSECALHYGYTLAAASFAGLSHAAILESGLGIDADSECSWAGPLAYSRMAASGPSGAGKPFAVSEEHNCLGVQQCALDFVEDKPLVLRSQIRAFFLAGKPEEAAALLNSHPDLRFNVRLSLHVACSRLAERIAEGDDEAAAAMASAEVAPFLRALMEGSCATSSEAVEKGLGRLRDVTEAAFSPSSMRSHHLCTHARDIAADAINDALVLALSGPSTVPTFVAEACTSLLTQAQPVRETSSLFRRALNTLFGAAARSEAPESDAAATSITVRILLAGMDCSGSAKDREHRARVAHAIRKSLQTSGSAPSRVRNAVLEGLEREEARRVLVPDTLPVEVKSSRGGDVPALERALLQLRKLRGVRDSWRTTLG